METLRVNAQSLCTRKEPMHAISEAEMLVAWLESLQTESLDGRRHHWNPFDLHDGKVPVLQAIQDQHGNFYIWSWASVSGESSFSPF